MVTNFDVFRKRVLHEVFAQVDGLFVVTHDRNVVEVDVVVDESLFHPIHKHKKEVSFLSQSHVTKEKDPKKEETQPKHHVQKFSPLPESKRLLQAKTRRIMTFSPKKSYEHHSVHKAREGHWKSKSKKPKSTTDEEDLSQPWLCEETDPLTLRIRNFEFPKRICMPSNVKTYDGSGDPDDHLKIFQTAAKLSPESINSYVELQKAFFANFLQQKKYIKDPVEIRHIRKREADLTEAFIECFKAESMHVKGAPKCMRVSRFMHGITNPDLSNG
ncbi:hypothetical protein Tco_1121253 [Tanacetum coccineum]|uniref:Reverse transcriptase domain-containing protein n=1 Tax=Tanacetum coccineum TaxID=301880 RepID=A0ABQ5IX77_9ASTR